jgi:hypothetical protein
MKVLRQLRTNRRVSWVVSLLVLLAAWMPGAVGQVPLTQLSDTIYGANGTPATGSVVVSWPAFTTASGSAVAAGTTAVTLSAGKLTLSLAPNAGAIPVGTYYTAVYHLVGSPVSRETWVIPVSATPVALSVVNSSVLPSSVAMQTVTKSYVDAAIAAAVTGQPLADSGGTYVERAGDTMTGPLILPGDPTSGLQASDKQYVDENVAGIQAGLNQKVSLTSATTQQVTQSPNTELDVNKLNGELQATEYLSGSGNNGVINAQVTADCAAGCSIIASPTYPGAELFDSGSLKDGVRVTDERTGRHSVFVKNPREVRGTTPYNAQSIVETTTQDPATENGQTDNVGLLIQQQAVSGGNNLFPENIESVPYFKSTYDALRMEGTYNTQGQHVLNVERANCYAVGDCLLGGRFITYSGGLRDSADEGAHPSDLDVSEDVHVFAGTCTSGCSTGSTQVQINATAGPGTQGDGRFLIDTTASKTISNGSLIGFSSSVFPLARFSGTLFPVSTFFQNGTAITSQAGNIAPGQVTVTLQTTGVPAGYQTNTAAASATSGIACFADPGVLPNFEMVPYQVIDGTHLRMTLRKPHVAGATISIGGLCGYGIEQTVDTVNGIRQLFPIVGAVSSTSLFYAAGIVPVLGNMGATSGYINVSLPITSVSRQSGLVTLTFGSGVPASEDISGLTMTVSGVSDSSYNGTFVITTTGSNTLTYAESGADSTSSGGTISVLTGGFVMYPMAEVVSVFNTTTNAVDGQMTLAPNLAPWAAGDTVEMPHYYLLQTQGDGEYYTQVMPRPLINAGGSIHYGGQVGQGVHGLQISNDVSGTNYFGQGGSHTPPQVGLQVTGVWNQSLDLQAGEFDTIAVHCNNHGCNRWNSKYDLFDLDSAVGLDILSYNPQTSVFEMAMRGTLFTFSPQSFTTNTINVGTINASAINVNGAPVGSSSTGSFTTVSAGSYTVNASGGQYVAFNEDSVKCKFCTYYSASAGANWGLGQRFFQQTFVANDGGGGGGPYQDSIGFFIGQNPGSANSADENFQMWSNSLIGRSGASYGWSGSSTGSGTPGGAPVQTGGFSSPAAGVVSCDTSAVGNGQCSFTAANIKAGENLVGYSATPVFSTNAQVNTMTLSGNVSSFTLAAGSAGQQVCLVFVQDGTGGRTVGAPGNVRGFFAVGGTANRASQQCFSYSGALAAWVAQSAGAVNF